MRRILTQALWVVFGLLLSLTQANAQEVPPEKQAQAQAKYEEGERHYKLGEFTTALSLYRESYLLSGAPDLLFNIAQCHRQLKNYEEALKTYKAYLRDVPESPVRADVEAFIRQMEEKIKEGPTSASNPTSTPTSLVTPASQSTTPSSDKLTVKEVWTGSRPVRYGAYITGAGFFMGGLTLGALIRANTANKNGEITLAQQNLTAAKNGAPFADGLILIGLTVAGLGVLQESREGKKVSSLQLAPSAGTGVGASFEIRF